MSNSNINDNSGVDPQSTVVKPQLKTQNGSLFWELCYNEYNANPNLS